MICCALFMLLIALMAGGYFLLRFLGRKLIDFINLLITASSKLDAVIIAALITAAVTINSGIISKIIDFKQNRREYLSQKREEPYAEFINVYYKMQEKASKKMKNTHQKKCLPIYKNFKKN